MGIVDLIGAGRVGGALHRRAVARGVEGVLVSRTAGWEALAAAAGRPILVCTRNDDLPDVLRRTPSHRRSDLVFVQNGALRTFLAEAGLASATRGLLFFAVPTRADDVDAGAVSPFVGPAAEAVVSWLTALDVPAAVVAPGPFAEVELEKLTWNSALGLLGDVYQCAVGDVLTSHGDQLRDLVHEYVGVGAVALGIEVDTPAMLGRILAYSASTPAFPARVKEWPWRNGWFVSQAASQHERLPTHEGLVAGLTPGRV